MTLDPRIEMEHFKLKLKDYRYNQLKAIHLNEELKRIAYELENVNGVDPSKEGGQTYHSGAKPNRWYELIVEEEETIKERDECIRTNKMIDKVLKMLSEEEETIIRDAFINFRSVNRAARHHNYNLTYFYEKIDNILIRLFE